MVSWATIVTIRTTMINDTCGARPVVAAGVVDPAAHPQGVAGGCFERSGVKTYISMMSLKSHL